MSALTAGSEVSNTALGAPSASSREASGAEVANSAAQRRAAPAGRPARGGIANRNRRPEQTDSGGGADEQSAQGRDAAAGPRPGQRNAPHGRPAQNAGESRSGPGSGSSRTGSSNAPDKAKRREGGIRIFVKDAAKDRTLTVVLPRKDCTVDDLKFAIGHQINAVGSATTNSIRLIYGGKVLEDAYSLAHYAISNDFTVHLMSPGDAGVAEESIQECKEDASCGREQGHPAMKRSTSLQTLGQRAGNSVRRSHSLESLPSPSNGEAVAIPCEALRYADSKWYAGKRGSKTAKGYVVTFNKFASEGEQDTSPEHIKLSPNWWRSLKEEDMISLEPLSKLRYEPFELPASADTVHWFDGLVLANYLVSSANFVHPVSRRPLERAEMVRLDSYLERHALCQPKVVHVFDKKDDSSDNAVNHVGALRREARDLLGALFAGGSADSRARRAQRDGQRGGSSGLGLGGFDGAGRGGGGGGDGGRRQQQPPQAGGRGGRAARVDRRQEQVEREARRREEELTAASAELHQAAEVDVPGDEVPSRNQELVRQMKQLFADAAERAAAAAAAAAGRGVGADSRSSGAGRDDADAVAAAAQERFDELREVSAEFRRGDLPGAEYARRLFGTLGHREAPAAARARGVGLVAELIRLLPDRHRRRDLATAAAEWLAALAAEEAPPPPQQRQAQQRGGGRPPQAARGAGGDSDDEDPWAPPVAAGAAAAAADGVGGAAGGVVIDQEVGFPSLDGGGARQTAPGVFGGAWLGRPSAAPRLDAPAAAAEFPSLDGGAAVTAGVFGGAWVSRPAVAARPDDAPAAAGGGGGEPADAPEQFPSLPAGQRPAAAALLGAWGGGGGHAAEPEPAPVVPVTRRTKRGALLLHFG